MTPEAALHNPALHNPAIPIASTTAGASTSAIPGWVEAAMVLALLMIGVAILLSAWRLVIGPAIADRVIAMDLIMVMALAAVALFSILYGLPALIDIAVVLALIMFVATVAFAWFIERAGEAGVEPSAETRPEGGGE